MFICQGRKLFARTRGLLQMFNTVDKLLSRECRLRIEADLFDLHPWGTDHVECMNSVVTRECTARGPGRNFVQHARENFLSQISNVHQANGG